MTTTIVHCSCFLSHIKLVSYNSTSQLLLLCSSYITIVSKMAGDRPKARVDNHTLKEGHAMKQKKRKWKNTEDGHDWEVQ